ncbi:MAG: hypothetical protein LBU37_07410 [Tannerellaceae bacterium]|jgi:hypothetical protein|nr:hypothetical protein [Tannerellaceae bacterium]
MFFQPGATKTGDSFVRGRQLAVDEDLNRRARIDYPATLACMDIGDRVIMPVPGK